MENWCIKNNNFDYFHPVIKYLNSLGCYYNGSGNYYGIINGKVDCKTESWNPLISLDYFTKYILNKSVNKKIIQIY